MRSVVEQALPGTAIIESSTFVSDGGGGGTTSWTASGTVACSLAPIGPGTFGTERDIADRVAEDAHWIVTLPAETAIDPTDRVQIGGVYYEVLALHAPRSWELSRRAEVAEVV